LGHWKKLSWFLNFGVARGQLILEACDASELYLAILEKEEKPVVEYKWDGADINEVQAEWQLKLERMIVELSVK
jgi:hypothetical protein